MIVSWNWLKEYVRLEMSAESLGDRLMMAGLNLGDGPSKEIGAVYDVDGDIAIDVEVTSNRPDCLGMLGIARETSVLYSLPLKIPAAQPVENGPKIDSLVTLKNERPELCPQYTARLIRGVKIGPSPDWMQRRLRTLGLRPVNNVVDVTNYVLMECGQPLHAFDFDKLHGGSIVVREAAEGEKILAIDQKQYPLQPGMCVIADADRPVAVAGVMGGLETEISEKTVNVLIEVAEFVPMTVRSTARKLGLHSPSSYRFERGIDQGNLDWASRRCAELILQVAGGTLCTSSLFAGNRPPAEREPVRLRYAQFRRIMGFDIQPDVAQTILVSLGLKLVASQPDACVLTPPSWRRDLTREIDLIEEIARVHGYDKIPENAAVPMAISSTTQLDRVSERIAGVLTAAGFFEAITVSFVRELDATLCQPWDDAVKPAVPLRVEHSTRQLENCLRRSLIPSLLAARRFNERHGASTAQLFEFARVYLNANPTDPAGQPLLVSGVTGRSFGELKGVVETLLNAVHRGAELIARPTDRTEFAAGRGAELFLNGQQLGWLGEVSDAVRSAYELHDPVTVFELSMNVLETNAKLIPQFVEPARFPAIDRDLNLVLDDAVTWHELATLIRQAAGPLLETVEFGSQYRGPQVPANKKSYVARMLFRSNERTLTTEDVEGAMTKVITQCTQALGAVQR